MKIAMSCQVITPYGVRGALVRVVDRSETGHSTACTGGHGWYRARAWGSASARVIRDDSIANNGQNVDG